MQRVEVTLREFAETFGAKKPRYSEIRDFIESRRPEWVRALVPRIIEAPAVYWPQKVLAVAAIEAALCNQLATNGGGRVDRTFSAVEAHMGHLLEYDVPTFYVSKELLAAASRTELPMDMFLDAIPFPFPALVFMFPRGSVRHVTAGECPFITVSRQDKGQEFMLPLEGAKFGAMTMEKAVSVTTYLPEENCCYERTISVVDGETIKEAFERASKIPFEIPGAHLRGDGDSSIAVDADFADRLWLIGLTLVLIMASGERLLEEGRCLKVVKGKKPSDGSKEFWSPNFLGRVYRPLTEASESEDGESHLVRHWRKGHVKSQPHGPKHSLRKIIWIQPYRAGRGASENA